MSHLEAFGRYWEAFGRHFDSSGLGFFPDLASLVSSYDRTSTFRSRFEPFSGYLWECFLCICKSIWAILRSFFRVFEGFLPILSSVIVIVGLFRF